MKKLAIYSAIFGKYDILPEDQYILPDADYICFADHFFESDLWDVRVVPSIYEDPTRMARKYKLLPHRFLPDYKFSAWIDGNMKLLSDFSHLLNDETTFLTYDHMQCFDKRNCIYQEAEAIFTLGKQNLIKTPERGNKNWKDNPELIVKQVEKYRQKNFPENFGLAETSVVIRQHNKDDVRKLDEDWWLELKYGSRRDQLSLNYVSWKNNIPIEYISGDVRSNEYFIMLSGHKGKR